MNRVSRTLACIAVLSGVCALSNGQKPAPSPRGLEITESSPASAPGDGAFYALVIGIDQYHAPLPSLKTAVNDARGIANVLSREYGFRVKLLLDGNATRSHILDAIDRYSDTLRENDSLLIYYAGHGFSNSLVKKTYWLPADAEQQTTANWIIADDITSRIRGQNARHVLVISDSCYAGGLSRGGDFNSQPEDQAVYLKKMELGRSRTLMASGGNEPVSDNGADGHSVFANAVLRALDGTDLHAFAARDLFSEGVVRQVAGKAQQIPQYAPIRDSDDDNGDFVFIRSANPSAGHIDVDSTGPRPAGPEPPQRFSVAPDPKSTPPPSASTFRETVDSMKRSQAESDPNSFVRLSPSALSLGSQWQISILAASVTGTPYDVKLQIVMTGVGNNGRAILLPDPDPSFAAGMYAEKIEDRDMGKEAVICYTAHTSVHPDPLRVTATYSIRKGAAGYLAQAAFVPAKPPTIAPASDAPCGGLKVSALEKDGSPTASSGSASSPAPLPSMPPAKHVASLGIYADTKTGLLWTANDNGADSGFSEATTYCSDLRLDGQTDWRLPTIDELNELYDQSGNARPNCKDIDGTVMRYPIRIRNEVHLGCYSAWSTTKGRGIPIPNGTMSTVKTFNFFNRGINDEVDGIGYHANTPSNIRTLCVRSSSGG